MYSFRAAPNCPTRQPPNDFTSSLFLIDEDSEPRIYGLIRVGPIPRYQTQEIKKASAPRRCNRPRGWPQTLLIIFPL